jgi:hypothetical protein
MPRLNHVFEELEVQHQERLVPAKVLKSVAEKERKAVMKNVTVMAEAMERKVSGRGKVISKKWKTGAAFTAASASSGEEVEESGVEEVPPTVEEEGDIEASAISEASVADMDAH